MVQELCGQLLVVVSASLATCTSWKRTAEPNCSCAKSLKFSTNPSICCSENPLGLLIVMSGVEHGYECCSCR